MSISKKNKSSFLVFRPLLNASCKANLHILPSPGLLKLSSHTPLSLLPRIITSHSRPFFPLRFPSSPTPLISPPRNLPSHVLLVFLHRVFPPHTRLLVPPPRDPPSHTRLLMLHRVPPASAPLLFPPRIPPSHRAITIYGH